MARGNFSWLNVLTMVVAVRSFDRRVLTGVLSAPRHLAPFPAWYQGVSVALALLVAGLRIRPTRKLAWPGQLMNSSFDPLHLVNTHGAFGRVTKAWWIRSRVGELVPPISLRPGTRHG